MTGITWDRDAAMKTRRRLRDIEQLQLLTRELSKLIQEERRTCEEEVAQFLRRDSSDIILSTSTCETSPVLTCIYEFTFGGDNKCLCCHKPQEL